MPARITGFHPRHETSQRGVSLILVMLSMLVLSVLAATIVFTARSETLASYNWKLDTQADYLAKAGIQSGVQWLRSTEYTSNAVGTSTALTYYQLTQSSGTYKTLTANTSPVKCVSSPPSSTCTASNPIQLFGIPGTGSSNYPSSTVVSNFNTDFSVSSGGVRVTGDQYNSGVFYVNMTLLNFQTVESGTPPTLTPVALETWLITSRAYWTGTSSGVSSASVAMAEEQAIVQPIYVPTWGNAMYGYCSAGMGGSAGTCTDAFNSALGAYAAGNNSTASGACGSTTATNVIDAGAGVGANGYVSLGSNVSVSGNVTIGSGPAGGSACCGSGSSCGFQGSTSGIQGQIVAGPNIPLPTPFLAPSGGSYTGDSTAPSYPGGTITYAQQCNPPTATAGSGGLLATGMYYYTVTALGAWGESAEGEVGVSVTGPAGKVTLSWSAVSGATSYNVYATRLPPPITNISSSGNEGVYFNTTTTSYTDTGLPGTAGSPPGVASWPVTMTAPSLTVSNGTTFPNNQQECYVVTAILGTGLAGSWGESGGQEVCVTVSAPKRDITVSWNAFSNGAYAAASYNVYRGTTPGNENIFVVNTAGISYADPNTSVTAGAPPPNRWSKFMSGTGANPPFLGCSAPCDTGGTCDGTANNPFQISSISMSGNSDLLQLIGGKDIFHPVYYDTASISMTGANASILLSGYVVLQVRNSLSIAGKGVADPLQYQSFTGLQVNVPPECLQLNYAGSSAVSIGGNGSVSALVTAPYASVNLGGGGASGYMIGSIRALNVSMQGGYPLHYDVQLSKAGGVVGVMTTTAYNRKKF